MSSEPIKNVQAFANSLLVTVVTYQQAFESTPAYHSLIAMASFENLPIDVCVFDNSPVSYPKPYIHSAFFSLSYFVQNDNPGLSFSYNKAFQKAVNANKQWLLLLDQDANLPNDFLHRYFDAVNRLPLIHFFCPILTLQDTMIISPFKWIFDRPFRFHTMTSGLLSTKNAVAVNSCSLISLEAITKIQGYDERVKIDFSDIVFFEKFKKYYHSFGIIDLKTNHELNSVLETNKGTALKRFSHYCKDARVYCKRYSWSKAIILFSMARALKLMIHWKDFHFFNVWVDSFLFCSKPKSAL